MPPQPQPDRRGFNGAAVRKRRRDDHNGTDVTAINRAASMGPPFENGGG